MKQSCKWCGAVVGVHQHSFRCPRFLPCISCRNDISKDYRKRGYTRYHPWCGPKDVEIIEVTCP